MPPTLQLLLAAALFLLSAAFNVRTGRLHTRAVKARDEARALLQKTNALLIQIKLHNRVMKDLHALVSAERKAIEARLESDT